MILRGMGIADNSVVNKFITLHLEPDKEEVEYANLNIQI